MRRLRAGITLVEVLIVIAILAIIAAFAYPVFQGGKRKSMEGSCMQQMRQIYMALKMYAGDYPNYLPVHPNVDIPNAPMLSCGLLHPYLKSRDLYYCPGAPQCVRKDYFSTYTWMASLEDPKADNYELYMKHHNATFDDPSKPFPILYCLVHDELTYLPAERHLSKDFNPPWATKLFADGSVKGGRLKVLRNFLIAKACAGR